MLTEIVEPRLDVPTDTSVFDGMCRVYRSDGYDAGYRRAVNDVLADLVLVSEEMLRDRPDLSAEARKAVRAFRGAFERHLDSTLDGSTPTSAASRGDGYVDGGLGI